MYRSLPPRHLALLWIPAIALFWTAIVPASSTAKCTPTCAASGWQKHAQGMYLISGSRSPAEPFRLVGFGSALANAAISCPPAENPSIWDAQAIWQDFRFYGSSPALGLFRGEIDREKVSSLTLQSLSSVGLFPAAFTNDLFLRLTPLALPSLEYRNPEIMRMQAVVHQAPPELSMVGLQVNPQDVFEATSPVPGTPEAIVLTDSRQTFLPSGCLTAERLPATGDALRIRVGYPGERAVKAAYFLHGQGTDPAAFARLDGIVAIPAGGTADIEMSLTGISAGSAIFDAIVLEPFDVDCAARLTVALLTGPDETPPVCRVQRFITGPPTRLEIFVQDGESGLDSIEVQESMNAAVDVPLFAQGTNAALIVVGTKIDQSTSSRIELKVTDLAGNVTLCDPILTEGIRSEGRPARTTYAGVPAAERWVTILNGNPGLRQLDVEVNGVRFKVKGLQDGEERLLDVGSAVIEGTDSVITLTTHGKPGGSAAVMIWDGRDR